MLTELLADAHQQLAADADAEERATIQCNLAQWGEQAAIAQSRSSVTECTDTRQNDCVCSFGLGCI